MISDGCTTKDQYGSNDCTLNWGSNYTITYVYLDGPTSSIILHPPPPSVRFLSFLTVIESKKIPQHPLFMFLLFGTALSW